MKKVDFERNNNRTIAEDLIKRLEDNLPIVEMRNNRGVHFRTTNAYQIRVKSKDQSHKRDELLKLLEATLASPNFAKLGFDSPVVNQRSVNSGRFSSVTTKFLDVNFDIVVAEGANNGEKFEKELIIKMDNLIAGIDDSQQAKKAFAALNNVDPKITIDNVLSVAPRAGTTKRSGDLTPNQMGEIIGDMVIQLKDGTKRFVSVKNISGNTIAQFGVSAAFNNDLSINTESTEWKMWIEPFGLDVEKLLEAFKAARRGKKLAWKSIQHVNTPVPKGSKIYKLFQKMWGVNYIYLRETSGSFFATVINKEYVDDFLLKNLRVTEIRYPSQERKQISIYVESDTTRFKIDIRNARGKSEVKPTQIQLMIMKTRSR